MRLDPIALNKLLLQYYVLVIDIINDLKKKCRFEQKIPKTEETENTREKH